VNLFLFDMDGTLLDTLPALEYSMIQTYKKYGNGEYRTNIDDLRGAVTYGRDALASVVFNTDNPDKKWGIYAEKVYNQTFLNNTNYFSGVEKILEYLITEKIKFGIVTSKPRYLTEQLCSTLELLSHSDIVICPEDVKHKKPDPEPLLLACSKLGVDVSEAIYVGDSDVDIESANNCKMNSIFVEYGYLPQSINVETLDFNYIANNTSDLFDIIKSLR
jgi:N-acetyl-D-muramate 6-phosphate phosphatase